LLDPPDKLDDEPLDDEPVDDESLAWMSGSTFVYSRRNVQNAQLSTTSALPLLIVLAAAATFSVDDFVRWWHCGHGA
jgi:hypothetical protein